MTSLHDTLQERGNRYGDYATQARIVEDIINTVRNSPNWERMPPYQRVAVYLIALKLGRVCTGDIEYADNWVDIAGYAQLVVNELC